MQRGGFGTKGRRMVVLLSTGAMLFQFGFLPSCRGLLTTLNPCGTILGFCSQEDIDFFFADIPDPDLDPTCTIPFRCNGPIFPTPGPRP